MIFIYFFNLCNSPLVLLEPLRSQELRHLNHDRSLRLLLLPRQPAREEVREEGREARVHQVLRQALRQHLRRVQAPHRRRRQGRVKNNPRLKRRFVATIKHQ